MSIVCAVCGEQKAIPILETGVFVPCVECLCDGWELVRWRTRWGRWRARQRAKRPGMYRRRPERKKASDQQ